MNALSQNKVIELVKALIAFADDAENLISSTQDTYSREMSEILTRHHAELSSLDGNYKATYDAISNKSKETIGDAKRTLSEIKMLDERLSAVDKYYVKMKEKREELFTGITDDIYNSSTDYFEALSSLKEKFAGICKKYSGNSRGGVFDSISYFLSEKRKNDYMELIILKNTVSAFVKEIEEALPQITEEHLSSIQEEYTNQRSSTVSRQKTEISVYESNYTDKLDSVADKIWDDFDRIFPDDVVCKMYSVMERGKDVPLTPNTARGVRDGVLNLCIANLQIDLFVASELVSGVIRDKCAKLMDGDVIRFPIIMTPLDSPVWMIVNDEENELAAHSLTHSIMFSLMSSCPAGSLSFTVCDPENNGYSVSPFLKIRDELPCIFGDGICSEDDDISAALARLNEKITRTSVEVLGYRYDNVFEYAEANPDYKLSLDALVIYDFPHGLDERGLANLLNIVRKGSRCGVFTVISCYKDLEEDHPDDFIEAMQEIVNASSVIGSGDTSFTLCGLPITYTMMPRDADFKDFATKYALAAADAEK